MNKVLKYSLVLLSLTLIGCSNKSGESNSLSDEGDSSSLNNSQVIVQDSKWGKQYNDVIIGNLGEDVPYIESDGYDIVLSTDDYDDPMVIFYVYFDESIEAKMEEYSMIAQVEGYSVTLATQSTYDPTMGFIQFDIYYADKVIDNTRGIELQFLEGTYKGKECMGIFAFNYAHDDEYSWPTNLVTSLLGYDIPHLEDNGTYKYYARINSEGYIDMVIYNVDSNAADEYEALLKEYGFTVTEDVYDQETGEYMGKYAYAPNGEFVVQLYLKHI